MGLQEAQVVGGLVREHVSYWHVCCLLTGPLGRIACRWIQWEIDFQVAHWTGEWRGTLDSFPPSLHSPIPALRLLTLTILETRDPVSGLLLSDKSLLSCLTVHLIPQVRSGYDTADSCLSVRLPAPSLRDFCPVDLVLRDSSCGTSVSRGPRTYIYSIQGLIMWQSNALPNMKMNISFNHNLFNK